MTTKVIRSQKERYEISAEISDVIPIGEDNKIAVTKITQRISSYHQGNKSDAAFKKEVERLCAKIHEVHYNDEDNTGLIRVGKRRAPVYYYWSDVEVKEHAIDLLTITRPRALALFLVKEHIADILPTSYLSALSSDFKLAEKKLEHDRVKLSDILEYSPFGFNLVKAESSSSAQTEATFNLVFEAVLSRKVIKIEYRSIHPKYASKSMYVSGQKLRYLNNRLQLLGYEHDTPSQKHFALSKITSIELAPEVPFILLDPKEYETQQILKIRCHTWVKDTFESSRLGGQVRTENLGNDVLELTEEVTFPLHFNGNRPDGFYIANFLSMYGDSVEVLEPDFLRAEMQRRSSSMDRLYSGDNNTSEQERKAIMSASPENIVNLK
jgi:predicted DNA-binding transcriptional regulator YafY